MEKEEQAKLEAEQHAADQWATLGPGLEGVPQQPPLLEPTEQVKFDWSFSFCPCKHQCQPLADVQVDVHR